MEKKNILYHLLPENKKRNNITMLTYTVLFLIFIHSNNQDYNNR